MSLLVFKIGKTTSVTRCKTLALTFPPQTTKGFHPDCKFGKVVPELKNAQGRVTLPPATLAGAGLAHTPVAVLNPGQAAAATTATPIFRSPRNRTKVQIRYKLESKFDSSCFGDVFVTTAKASKNSPKKKKSAWCVRVRRGQGK